MVEIPAAEKGLAGEEPAAAWRRITGCDERVLAVERLKKNKRTRVYRLDVSGRAHAVIAKRCREKVGVLENAVYTRILANGPLRAPAFYGFGADPFTDDEHTYYWVFVEDLGPRRHAPADAGERQRLARWLGAFHALTAAAAPSRYEALPDRRMAYYKAFLAEAAGGLPLLARSRVFPASISGLIDGVVRDLERVDAHWASLESLVGATPAVVAHGDCLPKNIHVAADEAVIPIDWGSAGIGFPGFDLGVSSILLSEAEDAAPCVDAYVQAIRPAWPDADARAATRLARAGRTLWVAKLIAQTLPGFQSYATSKVETYLRLYAALLKRSAEALLRTGRDS
jgi:Ser/Thr protein kinase RdoA (MazF antagonist)